MSHMLLIIVSSNISSTCNYNHQQIVDNNCCHQESLFAWGHICQRGLSTKEHTHFESFLMETASWLASPWHRFHRDVASWNLKDLAPFHCSSSFFVIQNSMTQPQMPQPCGLLHIQCHIDLPNIWDIKRKHIVSGFDYTHHFFSYLDITNHTFIQHRVSRCQQLTDTQ